MSKETDLQDTIDRCDEQAWGISSLISILTAEGLHPAPNIMNAAMWAMNDLMNQAKEAKEELRNKASI
tara:strand:- start:28 stop:231 length:204 start_codon:yes stop_codon:yes gene_type:complete